MALPKNLSLTELSQFDLLRSSLKGSSFRTFLYMDQSSLSLNSITLMAFVENCAWEFLTSQLLKAAISVWVNRRQM